jgi:hypothetical protein
MSFKLNVTIEPVILSVVTPNVTVLSVVAPSTAVNDASVFFSIALANTELIFLFLLFAGPRIRRSNIKGIELLPAPFPLRHRITNCKFTSKIRLHVAI